MIKFSLLSLVVIIPTTTSAALVTTWTASQNAADLGDPGAATVQLFPSPVVNIGGNPVQYTSSSTNTDFTDVVELTTTQQEQLAGAGLSITQGLNNVRGATRKLIGPTFQAFGGGNAGNTTIDFFISPDKLDDVSQLIFETGGNGAGSSLNMNGSIMTFAAAQNAATAVKTTVDLNSIYAGTPNTDDMLHVRLGIDMANDTISLSAANLATGLSTNNSIAFTGTIWAGADNTGFFNVQGSTGGSAGGNVPASYANFDGQLGAVSRYNTVLAPIPEPSSVVLLGLAACGFLRRRR